MPTAAPRPCRYPGCSALVPSGACEAHRSVLNQRPGGGTHVLDERGRRVYDRHHQRMRRYVLVRNPICTGWPAGRRCLTPATVADHIVPLRVVRQDHEAAQRLVEQLLDREALAEFLLARDWRVWIRRSGRNYGALCAACHNRKTAEGL